MPKAASEQLYVRLPAGTRERLELLAAADHVDVSTIARRYILRGLDETEAATPKRARKVKR